MLIFCPTAPVLSVMFCEVGAETKQIHDGATADCFQDYPTDVTTRHHIQDMSVRPDGHCLRHFSIYNSFHNKKYQFVITRSTCGLTWANAWTLYCDLIVS
jgi:hypothetical protein